MQFESNQSGIETVFTDLFAIVYLSLNRTRVELKPLHRLNELEHHILFESNQSGIETRRRYQSPSHQPPFESNQSGIETVNFARIRVGLSTFESNQSGIETGFLLGGRASGI